MSLVTSAMSLVTSATCVELFALRKAVYSATRPNGDFYLATQRYAESLGRLSAGVHTVLRCLVDREHTRDELVAIAEERDGDPGAEGVTRLLDPLQECSVAEFALSSRPPDPPNEFDLLTRPPNEFDLLTRPLQAPPNEFDLLTRPLQGPSKETP
jgi:hypothetical protein